MPEKLTKASFEPYLSDEFEVHTETVGTVNLELVEITGHKSGDSEIFSVLFRGPVLHEKKDGIYYQAVFNHSVKK